MKEIDDLLDKARSIALLEVERIARKRMRNNKKLKDFTIAMGTYFFSYYGEVAHDYKCAEMDDFISEYDDILKLTGEGVIYKSDGTSVRDW